METNTTPQENTTRTCKKCGEEKPLSEFYRQDRDGKVRYSAMCMVCYREVYRERYHSCKSAAGFVTRSRTERNPRARICKYCGEEFVDERRTVYCSDACAAKAKKFLQAHYRRQKRANMEGMDNAATDATAQHMQL